VSNWRKTVLYGASLIRQEGSLLSRNWYAHVVFRRRVQGKEQHFEHSTGIRGFPRKICHPLGRAGKRSRVSRGFSEGLAAVSMQAVDPDCSVGPGVWGYIDKTNRFVIPPQFESAMEFSEGMAAVRINGQGLHRPSRGVVITPQFERGSLFRCGMATFDRNRKLAYIDKTGTVIISLNFD
jgi:WG containing repeat